MLQNIFHFDLEQGGALGAIISAAMNLIMEGIKAPLDALVQEVIGGKWKGQGAQRFVQEMTGDMIGGINNTHNNMSDFGQAIGRVNNTFQQAQSAATQIAGQVEGLFGDI